MSADPKIILYVDDDPDDLAMLRDAISEMGANYQIREAFDGLHALELLQQMAREETLPCLIVLDINMPRMDGKQTLVAIQNDKLLASVPVVLFSTSSSSLDKTFSQKKNVELITKPIDYRALQNAAGKLLSYCKV